MRSEMTVLQKKKSFHSKLNIVNAVENCGEVFLLRVVGLDI